MSPSGDAAVKYSARATSALISGDVSLTIGDAALTVTGLFDVVEVPYADVNALAMRDYAVHLETDAGPYDFAGLGSWCQPFFDALCAAYNKAVLRSLFVVGGPSLVARGDWRFTEAGQVGAGVAPVQVFENCVVTLPNDLLARRVPLAFVTGMNVAGFEVTLGLDDGATYQWAKLGFDTAPFVQAVQAKLRALRDTALAQVTAIDASLTPAQASQLAKMMPAGTAVPVGKLAGVAPSFVAALEARIAQTCAADTYQVFKAMGDPLSISVGFRKVDRRSDVTGGPPDDGDGDASSLVVTSTDAASGDQAPQYLMWMIAPSPDGKFVAVEFAQSSAATFVYRTGGDAAGFAYQLNRALEAIDFHREVIRLSDEELRQPENVNYKMAAKRTAALRFVRANFVERVIHTSMDAWKANLQTMWARGL